MANRTQRKESDLPASDNGNSGHELTSQVVFTDQKRENPIRRQNSILVQVLSVASILLGIALIILSQVIPAGTSSLTSQLLLAFGIALAPSGVFGLISDYLIFGRTMEVLQESNISLVDQVNKLDVKNEDLKRQVKALQISTDFLKASSELGLVMIYPDRTSALKEFAPLMRDQARSVSQEQKGRLVIVGSSIKGLREAIRQLDDIIRDASKNPNCEFRILLTHPQYCRFRENQEERPPGAIEEEIFDTMLLLEDFWAKETKDWKLPPGKSIEENVKLYKGTPTCFMIIAGDRMLINPYPYEKEAYKSFCLLVRELNDPKETDEVPKSIYQQFYANHFETPWRRNALPYKHFFLEGPIPNLEVDQKAHKRYGDVFVVQDSGKFHLIIVLSGERDAVVRGVPPSIPYDISKEKDIVRKMFLGDAFTVKLLPVTEDPDSSQECWIELSHEPDHLLKLDKDRRSGKFSCEKDGNLENEYQMIGLFSTNKHIVNPFLNAPFAKRKDLHGKPLPLFWYWIKDKPEVPLHPDFGLSPDQPPALKDDGQASPQEAFLLENGTGSEVISS